MSDPWKQMWDDRFGQEDYAYGQLPNEYLKAQLDGLKPERILFGAEGEGRNAVYAAQLGWSVAAFDISESGQAKALRMAKQKQVSIDYQVGELPNLNYEPESFDVLALIYAHIPPAIRSDYHQRLACLLRPGGILIFEGFGQNHLAYKAKYPRVGGPGDLSLLFSEEELRQDFSDFHFEALQEVEVQLQEGNYHQGIGSVVRSLARKKDRS